MRSCAYVHAGVAAVFLSALKASVFRSISWLASSWLHVAHIHELRGNVVVSTQPLSAFAGSHMVVQFSAPAANMQVHVSSPVLALF